MEEYGEYGGGGEDGIAYCEDEGRLEKMVATLVESG